MNDLPICFSFEYITPEIAKAYLDRNIADNRKIRNTNLSKMVSDLQNDAFVLSHQCIAFDADGNLFDGQHRMTAIVKSGCAAWMVVARYTDQKTADDVKLKLDIGAKRSITDNVKMSGAYDEDALYKNKTVMSLVRKLIWFENFRTDDGDSIGYGNISDDMILRYIREHHDKLSEVYHLAACFTRDGGSKKTCFLVNSHLGCALYKAMSYEKHEDLAAFVNTFRKNDIVPGAYTHKMALDARSMKTDMRTASDVFRFENYIFAFIHGKKPRLMAKERYPMCTIIPAVVNG